MSLLFSGNESYCSDSSTWDSCPIGSLGAKHGYLSIPSNGDPVRVQFTDTNLPLQYLESFFPIGLVFEDPSDSSQVDCVHVTLEEITSFSLELNLSISSNILMLFC